MDESIFFFFLDGGILSFMQYGVGDKNPSNPNSLNPNSLTSRELFTL